MLSPGGRGRDSTTPELAPRSPPCHTTDRQLTGAARGPLPDDVTQRAVADKGAFRVLTVPVEAKVGLQFTLVQVCGVTGGQAGEGGGGARALPGALPRRSPAWRLSVPVSGTAGPFLVPPPDRCLVHVFQRVPCGTHWAQVPESIL